MDGWMDCVIQLQLSFKIQTIKENMNYKLTVGFMEHCRNLPLFHSIIDDQQMSIFM